MSVKWTDAKESAILPDSCFLDLSRLGLKTIWRRERRGISRHGTAAERHDMFTNSLHRKALVDSNLHKCYSLSSQQLSKMTTENRSRSKGATSAKLANQRTRNRALVRKWPSCCFPGKVRSTIRRSSTNTSNYEAVAITNFTHSRSVAICIASRSSETFIQYQELFRHDPRPSPQLPTSWSTGPAAVTWQYGVLLEAVSRLLRR